MMILGIFFGVLCSVSSHNWLFIWMGMEINLMSFLAIMSGPGVSKKKLSLYFVTQSFGSLLFLFMALAGWKISNIGISIAFALKLGLVPFHFWVIPIVPSLSFLSMALLMTVQKIGPLMLLNTIPYNSIMTMLILMNALIGGYQIMFVSSIPLLVLFSSFPQLSWILSSMGTVMFYKFLFVYMVILMGLLYFISISNMVSTQMMLLNMGGIPPFLGFSVKLYTMLEISNWLIPPLLMGSCMSLYSYLRVMLASSVSKSNKNLKYVSPVALLLLIPF